LEKHLETIRRGPKRRTPVGPTLRVLRRQADLVEEDAADTAASVEALDDALDLAGDALPDVTGEERQILDRMRTWAQAAAPRPDSKARILLEWLGHEIRPGGKWSDRRVIIFTEYRQTLDYLMTLLAAEGYTRDHRVLTLHGEVDLLERETIKAAFLAAPDEAPVRILLATDSASEGIDLQRHCSRLIHYEVPWNPNRMEQRNGRIDRYGQPEPPQIFHFVDASFADDREPADPGSLAGDLEFIYRAVKKLDQMERDLFGKVAPVIEAQVEAAMMGKVRVLDTSRAEAEAGPVHRMLKLERDLKAQIQKLHDKLLETRRELEMSPENVEDVVSTALLLAGQPRLEEAPLEGVWPDPTGRRARSPVFHLPALTGSWARAGEGLLHGHTRTRRPITFDHTVAQGRDDVVLAHLNHRLVQMSLRLLRAEVWSEASRRRLYRVTGRIVDGGGIDAPVLVGHARLVVTGADGQRLHEELITAGGTLDEGRFRRLNVGQVERVLHDATSQPLPAGLRDRLVALWPRHRESLVTSLDARMADRAAGLQKLLAERCGKDQDDVRAILMELRAAIHRELRQEIRQLDLFDREEQDQFERDRMSLQRRYDEIPTDIERECAAVAARYAAPTPRMFPVAVSWLVPRSLAR
jgi:hypothetical protein